MDISGFLNRPSGKRWHDAAYWGILLVAGVVFFYMNVLTPFKEDDMAFSLIGRGTLHDLWLSQVDHFMTANGRFSDVMASLFCAYLGKTVFNVVNTLVFVVFAHLLSLLATGRRSIMALALLLAVVGTCYPHPAETMLWVAGSCNYMWAVTLSLALVYYLSKRQGRPFSWGEGVLLLVMSFIAGNFNEATSFGFFGGMCLYYLFNRREADRRVVVALTGYLLGILLIVASPGAWTRATQGDIVLNLGLSDMLLSRWNIFSERMWHFITPLAAMAVGIVALLWKGAKPLRRNIWTYIFLCLVIIMFALGILHERAYSALATVGFIIMVQGLYTLLARLHWLRLAVTAAALALGAYAFAHYIKPMIAYKAYEDGVIAEIVQAPREAILREKRFTRFSRFVTPLRFVSSVFFVREDIYCKYYDKDNVQFVSDSIYDRYHSGRLFDGAVELPVECDRPDVVSKVLRFNDQDEVLAVLNLDSLPFTSQQASYVLKPHGEALSSRELSFRRKYGLDTERTQHGCYPLHYQGQLVLVFPQLDSTVMRVEFPIDHLEPPTMVTFKPLSAPVSEELNENN